MVQSVGFHDRFKSLTDYAPMRWQCRLFHRLIRGDVPEACDIPTGLGKTSVIVIWLLALVDQARMGRVELPRRLVYIVNRRTVVDQATTVVERIRQRLLDPENPGWSCHSQTLLDLAATLGSLCAFGETVPLGISTLRGELADNEEWKADPARPAIVVGTIDMIGSKLLFSGYGDGRYGRAHHAGLIGYDTLIVHDEAHLTPAFSDLLRAVAQEQAAEGKRSGQPAAALRPIRVMELSATRRETDANAFTLEPEDQLDSIVRERITATKRLYLHELPREQIAKEVEEQKLPREKADKEIEKRVTAWPCQEIVRRAMDHNGSPCKVLVYVRNPEDVKKVGEELSKKLGGNADGRVALLTGTMRGYERDRLLENDPVFRAMLDPTVPVERTMYLVSTSAGEVGIDLDADHIVCDLTTLDALIQRLGRVNRRGGEQREARVDVVATDLREKRSDLYRAIDATLSLLRRWLDEAGVEDTAGVKWVDVSPRSLRKLLDATSPHEVQEAFSPRVPTPPLTDILLDNWSLTSIDEMPGRPEVAPFLHGLTADPPETFVAWRHEVTRLHEAGVDKETLRDWFGACRIEARERLRDRTDRVSKVLKGLLANLRTENPTKDVPVVILDERGNASWSSLSKVSDANLAYRTVVLPVEAGGLDAKGLLDPNAEPRPDLDVAELEPGDRRRERWIHRVGPDGGTFERLTPGEVADAPPRGLREKLRIPLRQPEEEEENGETVDLVLFVSPLLSALENPETTSATQTLEEHTSAIADYMKRIVDRLGLDDALRQALIAAARWHDKGKDRPVWQRYARNGAATTPLAKSPRYLHPRALGGYRHEFGSLLDAMRDPDLSKSPHRDLALHLIAAHHGWARPHFEPRSFDSSRPTFENDQAFSEVVRGFGQLQHKYGRWGLAWLESLVRCADIAASQQVAREPQTVFDSPEPVSDEVMR
jgi:CRISPR-associated endonuclease/helicase Cas3